MFCGRFELCKLQNRKRTLFVMHEWIPVKRYSNVTMRRSSIVLIAFTWNVSMSNSFPRNVSVSQRLTHTHNSQPTSHNDMPLSYFIVFYYYYLLIFFGSVIQLSIISRITQLQFCDMELDELNQVEQNTCHIVKDLATFTQTLTRSLSLSFFFCLSLAFGVHTYNAPYLQLKSKDKPPTRHSVQPSIENLFSVKIMNKTIRILNIQSNTAVQQST